MKSSRTVSFAIVLTVAALGFGQAPGETAPRGTAPQADNTKVNKRDRNAGAVTADQQKNNATDLELTRKIRQSVIADKSLSIYARNVKIISRDGVVTLKGPVKSDREKAAIVAMAVDATGDAGKVTDQISVKK